MKTFFSPSNQNLALTPSVYWGQCSSRVFLRLPLAALLVANSCPPVDKVAISCWVKIPLDETYENLKPEAITPTPPVKRQSHNCTTSHVAHQSPMNPQSKNKSCGPGLFHLRPKATPPKPHGLDSQVQLLVCLSGFQDCAPHGGGKDVTHWISSNSITLLCPCQSLSLIIQNV